MKSITTKEEPSLKVSFFVKSAAHKNKSKFQNTAFLWITVIIHELFHF